MANHLLFDDIGFLRVPFGRGQVGRVHPQQFLIRIADHLLISRIEIDDSPVHIHLDKSVPHGFVQAPIAGFTFP